MIARQTARSLETSWTTREPNGFRVRNDAFAYEARYCASTSASATGFPISQPWA